MPDRHELDIASLAANVRRGSVVAAAGCGKTEQIVKATQIGTGRKLILTHTHAGVDALRDRLKKRKVAAEKFRVETIAGWCLRYAASFRLRSGLPCVSPREDDEWNAVYGSAARLVASGAVDSVLSASYSGAFIDEYQDCSLPQHEVLRKLSDKMPVCVFGDPLQAIFDFKHQKPVDWDADVYPAFEKTGELTTPWRWKNADNEELAEWLRAVRVDLDGQRRVDLRQRPQCVRWKQLPTEQGHRQQAIVGICQRTIGMAEDGDRLVVIGDPVNGNSRAEIAKSLAKAGFSNIEPMNCPTLYKAARDIEKVAGVERLEAVMAFVGSCMTGCEKAAYFDAIRAHRLGRKQGKAKFGDLIALGTAVADGGTCDEVLELMEGFASRPGARPFRREMLSAMRAALRIIGARQNCDFADAIWEVQNRVRHAGRRVSKRSVGSTLLVKGLEFEHSIVIESGSMNRNDWYVALTRATKSVTIISAEEHIAAVT